MRKTPPGSFFNEEDKKVSERIWFIVQVPVFPVSNLNCHLNGFANLEIGLAVGAKDNRPVGEGGLFGSHGCVTLSDLAREAYNFLGQPDFLTFEELGLLIRVVHTTCYQHRLQQRMSGDPAREHPRGVYRALLLLGCRDVCVLAAAWLHDAIEDCSPEITLDDIRTWFGGRIAALVDGMTRDKQLPASVHMEKFLRIAILEPMLPILKLVDVGFNLCTLSGIPDQERRLRWLNKTLEVARPELLAAYELTRGEHPEAALLFEKIFSIIMGCAEEMRANMMEHQLQLAYA